MKEINYTILKCVCEKICDSIFLRFRSETLINYGSAPRSIIKKGSGSATAKIKVPMIPVTFRNWDIQEHPKVTDSITDLAPD